MAAAKKQTKKDLENRIAELEAKLNQLATKLESKPAEVKQTPPPEPPKPAEVKPAETKPAPKPAEAPKPTETKTELPVTFQAALEDAYSNSPMTDTHQYKAKTPGYSPAPNRYFVRRTAPVGKVPTTNWNEQKSKVPGYTQPSNQYFATRARMSYSPPDKTFGSFSGVNMTVEGIVEQTQQQAPPPKLAKGTLPKGF